MGGNTTSIVRVGQTVRRETGPWSAAVARLLGTLESAAIDGVPRHRGYDEAGREVLTFIPGEVAHYPLPSWLWDEQILVDAAALMRRIHDASAAIASDEQYVWRLPTHKPVEVVCHNDFAPYNLVFNDRRLVGAIDFDTASPGPRMWDLAYLAYRLVPYCEDADKQAPDRDQRRRRLDSLICAYGVNYAPGDVLRMISERLIELAEYTDSRAEETGRADLAGDAAMYRRDAARVSALVQRDWPTTCSRKNL